MTPTIAVAHYPEGAGHATRMLAIADAIESAGGTVRVAGGGAGTEFVSLNGYDEFEPTDVDYIDTFQDGSTWQTVSQSLPASLGRIADCQAWLAETEPDALVTDDMFAAMAARRCGVPQCVLKHDMPGLCDNPIERAGAGFHTRFQLSAAREFFYPVVWPGSAVDPAEATRIPPSPSMARRPSRTARTWSWYRATTPRCPGSPTTSTDRGTTSSTWPTTTGTQSPPCCPTSGAPTWWSVRATRRSWTPRSRARPASSTPRPTSRTPSPTASSGSTSTGSRSPRNRSTCSTPSQIRRQRRRSRTARTTSHVAC